MLDEIEEGLKELQTRLNEVIALQTQSSKSISGC